MDIRYSPQEVNSLTKEVENRVELDRIYGGFGSFFDLKTAMGCRSPPVSLILKIQIDRRKEKCHNALKEENIGTTLIH